MKKIALLLTALTALFASCAETEDAATSAQDEIKLCISVNEPAWTEAATKAYVKTGWNENDVISIWLDTNSSAKPNIVIKYDGTEWGTDESAAVEAFTASAEGYVKAVYNGNAIVAAKDAYQLVGNTLYIRLQTWTFLSGLQVVLAGLDAAKASQYSLSCNRLYTIGDGGYVVSPEAIDVATGVKGGTVTGIANADGVAFVFAGTDSYGKAADYTFYLTDNSGETTVFTQYVAAEKKLEASSSSMTGIKMAAGGFSDVINLSAEACANTYIVSAAGKYRFNATVKGNGGLDPITGTTATRISGISGVKVLWETDSQGNAIKCENGVYDIRYSDGYVVFSTPDSFTTGTAYVAVYDSSDNVLWSWLIWATAAPQALEYSKDGKSWKYMDRNLGALSPGQRGFIYQWGRKDPFPAYGSTRFVPEMGAAFSHIHVDSIESTVAYVTAHPTTFIATSDASAFKDKHNWLEEECNTLWDKSKTIYDPSPAGWIIPSYYDVVRTDNSEYSYFNNCYTTAGFGRWDMDSSSFHYGNAPGTGYCWTSTSRTDYPQSAYYIRSNGQLTYVNSKSDGYVIRCVVDPDFDSGSGSAQPYDINGNDLGSGSWNDNQ